MINNNNNKQLPNITTNNEINTHYVNIGSINVRGLKNLVKQQDFINDCLYHKLDIIGIQETHYTINSDKYNLKNNGHYLPYWAIDTTLSSSSYAEVGFLIKPYLAKHIHKCDSYKGRIIYLDLLFKGSKKLRIINVYVPPQVNNHRKDIQRKTQDLI
jgi:exonuclease III